MKDFSSALSTIDLEAAARAHPQLRRVHEGTFPLDMLNNLNIVRRPRHIVFNTSPSYKPPGTHWISIWLGTNMSIELVDSMGQRPISNEVIAFLRRHGSSSSRAVYISGPLQHWSSSTCGLYCLSHGLARARGCTLEKWLSQFGQDRHRNDRSMECQFMRETAIPSLFSPRLHNWRAEVRRACGADSRASKRNREGCAAFGTRKKKQQRH